jgi:hypothetical protein
MSDKILLEFFPEIVQILPESPGGSCCLKPRITQSRSSKEMYVLAQHIKWKYRDKIDLVVPSRTDSRFTLVKKYVQYQANRRKKKIKLKKLPALVLNGTILIQGELLSEKDLEKHVEKLLL